MATFAESVLKKLFLKSYFGKCDLAAVSQYVYDCKKLASLPAILNLSGILLWPVEAATDLAKQTHVTGVFSLSRAARPSTWLAPATQNQ